MKKQIKSVLILSCLAIVGIACSSEDTIEDNILDPTIAIEVKKKEFVTNYTNIVFASYADALNKLNELKTAVDTFVATPNENTFQTAKDTWLASREPYGQTEAYRFYDGPIDGGENLKAISMHGL
jgi:putative iron-regulated protein